MSSILFSKMKVKKISIYLLGFVIFALGAQQAISAYYSSRWLDAVMKELNWAKRKLDLTAVQTGLWNEGEEEFRQLLISMRGGRDKARAMYERAAIDAESNKDYSWLDDEIKLQMRKAIDDHNKVLTKWDNLDQSLSREQRQVFRSSMSEPVIKDWQHFSGRFAKYLNNQVAIAKHLNGKFNKNPTPNDIEQEKIYFSSMTIVAENYEEKRKASVRSVEFIMANPDARLSSIESLAERNWEEFWSSVVTIRKSTTDFWKSSSAKENFEAEKGKLYAAALRRQREMTPPSNN